jgi:hypothetical protein
MHPLASSLFAKTALLLTIALGACASVGCSQSVDPPSGNPSGGGGSSDYGVPTATAAPASTDTCATPAEGCPCNDLGATETCKATVAKVGQYVICGGFRTCERETGLWGACVPSVNLTGTADAGASAPSSPTH